MSGEDDLWQRLRRYTPARIGLARSGAGVETGAHLAFQLAHAHARDAVHAPFAPDRLANELRRHGLEVLSLHSQAADRAVYLARPDLGRKLDAESRSRLGLAHEPVDLSIVVADGLSAVAVHRHVVPLLDALIPVLDHGGWRRAPLALVSEGRVAIGDEIGAALRAKLVVVAIGERPGLSSPDSLGIYVTWNPEVGRTDAERNCISNIRPEGLAIGDAAARLFYLLTEARKRGLTGVMLKDESATLQKRVATSS